MRKFNPHAEEASCAVPIFDRHAVSWYVALFDASLMKRCMVLDWTALTRVAYPSAIGHGSECHWPLGDAVRTKSHAINQ